MCLLFTNCSRDEGKWEISSPDQTLKIILKLSDDNSETALSYMVSSNSGTQSDTVIGFSPLGILRNDGTFVKDLSFMSVTQPTRIDESYTMLIGKSTQCVNKANEITVSFKNKNNARINIILRAYDNGVAFRYSFPDSESTVYTINKELTGFQVPVGGKAWMAPYDKVTQYAPAYETYYQDGINIGAPAPGKEGWGFPMLFNTKGYWMLISEADLDENYFGSHLEQIADNGLYRIRQPESEEGEKTGTVNASSTLPWKTPWRFIVIGKTLNTIVESNMTYNLSAANKLGDVSWVKPGRASWSWWSDHPSSRMYKPLKEFVDFAKKMGWEYSLVDANWDIMEGGNIEQLVKYANSQGVGILMWYNSGGSHNSVNERPRDIMSDPVKRKEEFKRLHAWGVKGVKVDFFQSDKQHIIRLYHDIMKDAAENQIMVNFHGCTLPRGWSRTYPNLVSMEAVRGEEQYSFSKEYPEMAPWHNTILAFTRNVIGPMDYTPVAFSDQQFPHMTSYAHELALSIVFESGILHFADRIKSYDNLPFEPKNFLKDVPTVWDETKFIDGYPGKYVVIARRKGNNWYIGGINGEKGIKEITIKLSFLGKGTYEATIILDGKDSKSFATEKKEVKTDSNIQIKMLGNGGFTGLIKKI